MRVLLVGGIPRRIHQGPVDWFGHRFEMIRSGFDRIVNFNLMSQGKKATLDRKELEAFVDSTYGHELVLCEVPEALIISRERSRRGDPPIPMLALAVHGLKRTRAIREWYIEHENHDQWPEMLQAPWIGWIAASSFHDEILVGAGVPQNRIHHIEAGSTAYSMFLPNADFLLDGGQEADGKAANGLPADGVVIPGSGRRDPECYLRAARALPGISFTVVDEQTGYHRRRLANTGLTKLANVRWMRAMALESYIALLKRARLVVVVLQPGLGDCGHTTVALAHRLGAAVICSNVQGVKDYVKDGHNARLVEPGDPEALAVAISDLWEDVPKRMQLAENGRQTEAIRSRACRENLFKALEAAFAGLPERASRG